MTDDTNRGELVAILNAHFGPHAALWRTAEAADSMLAVGWSKPPTADEVVTHVVADADPDDPEHVDDCRGCERDEAEQYEQEREHLARAIHKKVNSPVQRRTVPFLVGDAERAVSAVVEEGWAPSASDTDRRRTLADVLALIETHDLDYPVRYRLVFGAMHLALAEGYAAGIAHDPAEPGYPVVYIELPTGQISWHMPEHPRPWDGHTTPEKYARIRAYVEQNRMETDR